MYNTDLPTRAELPTSAQLKRSTGIAAIAASLLLVTVVLPAEYAIDPTGVGRLLGLTEMGEIKMQLAEEAEADSLMAQAEAIGGTQEVQVQTPASADPATGDRTAVNAGLPRPVQSQASQVQPSSATPASSSGRSDEVSVTLAPGEGTEIKLVMTAGEKARFSWSADGGVLNYDTHGDGKGRSISYEKGRGVASDEGELEAAFDGNHGWFWRNRTDAPVTFTLRTSGAYRELKRMK